jgi:GDP-L-fucose synthase
MGTYSLSGKRVLVTGGSGFLGHALVPMLRERGAVVTSVGRKRGDLREQDQVRRLLAETKPQVVFQLAGTVGGILANRERPGEFCYDNLAIGALMLHESWQAGVEKFIGVIGGCSYPANAPSPISEQTLFNGYPQAESAPYSLAKAMTVVQAQAYRTQYGFNAIVLVPGNLYGPYDNFDLNDSHVIPALIRRFSEAAASGTEEVRVWGSGRATRDFIYVDDAAEGIIRGGEVHDGPEIINISSGTRVNIRELVETIAELTGYGGRIAWDTSMPEGQLDKGFAVDRMRTMLDFEPSTPLRAGLERTIAWYRANLVTAAV